MKAAKTHTHNFIVFLLISVVSTVIFYFGRWSDLPIDLLPLLAIGIAYTVSFGYQMLVGCFLGFLVHWLARNGFYYSDISTFDIFFISALTAMASVVQVVLGTAIFKYLSNKQIENNFDLTRPVFLSIVVPSILEFLITFITVATTSSLSYETVFKIAFRGWLGVVLASLIVLPVILLLINKKYESFYGDKRRKIMLLALVFMFLGVLLTEYNLELDNREKIHHKLSNINSEISNDFEASIDKLYGAVKTIKALYSSSSYVKTDEIKSFIADYFKEFKYVNCVGFLQRKSANTFKYKYKYIERVSDTCSQKSELLQQGSVEEKLKLRTSDDNKELFIEANIFGKKGIKELGRIVLEIDLKSLMSGVIESHDLSYLSYHLYSLSDKQLIYSVDTPNFGNSNHRPFQVKKKMTMHETDFVHSLSGGSVVIYLFSDHAYWLVLFSIALFVFIFTYVIFAIAARDVSVGRAMDEIKNEISKRKTTEKKLQNLNKNLEKEVLFRTEEIQEKNLEFESIFKSFPDVLFKINAYGTIISIEISKEVSERPYFSSMKIGKNIISEIPYDNKAQILKTLERAIETGKIEMFGFDIHDGEELRSYEGRFCKYADNRILFILRDITDRVEVEQKLQEQNLLALKSAKMVSLGEMAGGIAHEINNPLAIIDGAALLIQSMIEKGKVDEAKLSSSVGKIHETVMRIASIVTGLRKFARDGSEDDYEKIIVKEFIEESLSLCRERFKSIGVELKVKGVVGEEIIYGRRIELSQVLINLFNNAYDAVKNMTNKWVEVELIMDPDNTHIRISDSGPGVDVKVLDKIMDPFFTTKDIGEGTGLGLSISKGIVEHHGGRLSVDTHSEHTCFVISIPRRNEIFEATS